MDRADDCFGHMRFEFAQLRPREHLLVDTILVEPMRVRDRLMKALL